MKLELNPYWKQGYDRGFTEGYREGIEEAAKKCWELYDQEPDLVSSIARQRQLAFFQAATTVYKLLTKGKKKEPVDESD